MSYLALGMLVDVIADTLEREIRGHAPTLTRPHGLFVSFRTSVDYSKEEGYRHLELLLMVNHPPGRYVQVWTRDRWTVISPEHLEPIPGDEYYDVQIKEGKGYDVGASEWRILADHDSCWRDAIEALLRDRQDIIDFGHPRTGLNPLTAERLNHGSWYSILAPNDEELAKFREIYKKWANR